MSIAVSITLALLIIIGIIYRIGDKERFEKDLYKDWENKDSEQRKEVNKKSNELWRKF